ncbi:unnamed protein product [Dovyalis caffra]|uniref:Uncharacterized protein n=1 Tax=Dovyalis caffra TaxID=77055 RepID=A0AAV1RR96_9ROSI|nr:unnamed protein product [Dovyalis caffra]
MDCHIGISCQKTSAAKKEIGKQDFKHMDSQWFHQATATNDGFNDKNNAGNRADLNLKLASLRDDSSLANFSFNGPMTTTPNLANFSFSGPNTIDKVAIT